MPYQGSTLPRSVPGIISKLRIEVGLDSQHLEWHGHNDFYNAVANSTSAWLYGCSSVNTTLLGIGERTGNCPLEAMIIEYGQIKGNIGNVNLPLLTETAGYFEREMRYNIPPKTPFVGREFNVTRAGIHADGILKDEEIYNIFDTERLLNRPVVVAVNRYSGTAGIAAWINTYFRLKGKNAIDKKDPRIEKMRNVIEADYDKGRDSMMTNDELERIVKKLMPELFKKGGLMYKPSLCRVRIHSSMKYYMKQENDNNGVYNCREDN
jgi:isopropylmalate/homocitrate/citramalate synthase